MHDVIIIGAGLAGASAAWQLALRDQSVTVLERTVPANPEGSSHGSARIFRYAYAEQLYCDLAVRARAGWDELERQSGRTLLQMTGCVDFGEVRAPRQLAGILTAAGVEHELLSAGEASARWPQIAFNTEVLFQPGAGVIDPGGAVTAMLELARGGGNTRVLTGWEASRIERTATGFEVHSAAGQTVAGSRIVVAAGGWLPDLLAGRGLPEALTRAMPPLQVRQEQAYHFPYERPATDAAADVWPAFIHKRSAFQTYGLPGGRDAGWSGQKVAQYNGGPAIRSATDQDGQVRAENRQLMVEYVRRFLPGLVPEPYAETTCLFTNTPTEDFVLDGADGVVIVSACSGHGAKFAPLLGEMVAEMITAGQGAPDRFRVLSTVGSGPERLRDDSNAGG